MSHSPPTKRPREDEDDNVIRFRMKKVSYMKEEKGVFSRQKDIGNFPWKLSAKITQDKLSIELYCYNEEKSNMWLCEVSVQFSLINQIDITKSRQSKVMNDSYHWHNNDRGLCWDDEMISEIMDPQLGFIINDEIVIEAHIKMLGRSGNEFRKKPEFDFRSPSDTSDVTLNIGDAKFYVHKQASMLSIHSPKFHKYFYSDDKDEKKAFEALLEDVYEDPLDEMLQMIYRVGQPFKLNPHAVSAGILDEADKSLKWMGFDIEILFFWAEKHKLFCLQEWVYENITAAGIKKIKQADEYKNMHEQTKEKLFDKYIELTPTV